MRKTFNLFLVFCLSILTFLPVGSTVAQPPGTWFGGVTVGKDNLARILWGTWADGSFQVETVDSVGNVVVPGTSYGPYENWQRYMIATGQNGDTVVGMINYVSQQFAIFRLNTSNTLAGSSTPSYYNPNRADWPILQSINMDSRDYVWFMVSVPSPGDTTGYYNTAELEAYTASSGAATLGYGISSWQRYFDIAVRNDNTPCLLGWGLGGGPAAAYAYVMYPVEINQTGGYIFSTLLGQPPISTGIPAGSGSELWIPEKITATPDNHVQLYWTMRDLRSGTEQWTLGIWDIDPNGGISYSPAYTFENWVPWDAAASAFTGSDGQLRVVYYDATTGMLAMMTIDRSTWGATSSARL